MNASNKEYVVLHADAEWMKDILKHIDDILNKKSVSDEDIQSARWLIKQALKVERNED
jgi:predicted component of type VI protein secretion system